MTIVEPANLLRKLLLLDAGTCALMGVCLALGAGMLAALTGIPAPLLFYAGIVLLPIAAFMLLVALRLLSSGTAVWLIVLGNALWVLASLGLIFGSWIAPNAFGYAFIAGQAAVVALFTWLEYAAWRRAAQGDLPAGRSRAPVSMVGLVLLAATALLLQIPPAFADARGVDGSDDRQAIEQLIRRQVEVVNAGDYAAFQEGLTANWRYFTSAGNVLDFDDWKDSVSRYSELSLHVSEVRSWLGPEGGLAWVTFRGSIRGEVEGRTDDRELLFTVITEKTPEGWKLRHQQATETR
jgi:ketosteroid isomerase-like protein